eukprot:TRINITY_DN1783_c0_g1_i5.p1 TRINITY_DN1783_c0_g1~~TRINITY_DN1783_c0_g1_i5.p1  ORF type:complete len:251 (+),score=54.30 TRINITY_DN1783_c0_g1_i5:81-755(+)
MDASRELREALLLASDLRNLDRVDVRRLLEQAEQILRLPPGRYSRLWPGDPDWEWVEKTVSGVLQYIREANSAVMAPPAPPAAGRPTLLSPHSHAGVPPPPPPPPPRAGVAPPPPPAKEGAAQMHKERPADGAAAAKRKRSEDSDDDPMQAVWREHDEEMATAEGRAKYDSMRLALKGFKGPPRGFDYHFIGAAGGPSAATAAAAAATAAAAAARPAKADAAEM